MALTATGARKREAVAFLNFLHSAKARKVLEKYGFTMK
jgi:molybdate transport system substrate-binding protein